MRWELHVRFCKRPEGEVPSGLLDRLSRCCCQVIRKRRPGGCGRTFVTTVTPGQSWRRRYGSLTDRTGKVSTRRAISLASAVFLRRMRTPGSTSCTAKDR